MKSILHPNNLRNRPLFYVVNLVLLGSLSYSAHAQYPVSQGYWTYDHTEYDGEWRRKDASWMSDSVSSWGGYGGMGSSSDHQVLPMGVSGSTAGNGQVRPWFRWIRRTIQQMRPDGRGYDYVPDPNDNPPESLVISINGGGTGSAISDYENGRTNPGPNRMIDKEHVTISIFDEPVLQGTDHNGYTYGQLSVNKLRTIPARSSMQTDAQGHEVLAGPWLALNATVSLDGGRFVNQSPNSSGQAIQGYVGVTLGFSSEPQYYYAVSPNPLALALPPCPDPTPQPPLNQYVMPGGGGVFTIPCSVAYTGSDSTFYSRLLNGLSWTIARPPSPSFTQTTNGSTASTGPCGFFPRHNSPTVASPFPGLSFVDNLPSTNSSFGLNSITHGFEGKDFAVSKFALFYESGAHNHPADGAVKFCGASNQLSVHLQSDYGYQNSEGQFQTETPNWFYYYSQAWTPPCNISYWDIDAGAYTNGDQYVHIGNLAHGRSIHAPLFEIKNGKLQWIGYYVATGIDMFARIVTHENNHKQIWGAYYNSIIIAEGDNVPDVMLDSNGDYILDAAGRRQANDLNADPDDDGIPTGYEIQLGLNPMDSDSTGFYDFDAYPRIKCEVEAVARYAENLIGTSPDRMKDWANDGLNFGREPGQCSQNRIKKYAMDAFTPLP